MTASDTGAANQSWQRSTDCVSQQVEDSLVILDMTNGEYVALNETAAAIWEQLEEPTPFEQIVASMQDVYAVNAEECAAAVGRTLASLSDKGLVQAVD